MVDNRSAYVSSHNPADQVSQKRVAASTTNYCARKELTKRDLSILYFSVFHLLFSSGSSETPQ